MAQRSVADWYNIIISEKENQAVLATTLEPSGSENAAILINELNSNSKVAIWRLFAYIIAAVMYLFEGIYLSFQSEINSILATSTVGLELWWFEVVKAYQDGDALQILTSPVGVKYIGYATIVEETDPKRIIKFVSFETLNKVGYIKVAKSNAGLPEPLTPDELARFKTYVDRRQPFGCSIVATSDNADLLLYDIEVYYDGLLLPATVEASVNAAVNNYLINLEFGGKVEVIRLIDAIQSGEGVKDVLINSLQAKPDGGFYVDVVRNYQTTAGYVSLDNDSLLTLTPYA